MATVHRNLTGADLHEPKGADTALSGQVYVANGSGGGSWVDASTVITNSAFTTGDLKTTHKTTADTGWILWQEGSIGDGSSSATLRANADCEDLFLMYWNGYSNTLCPVSGGRGASAAADWAAHKRLTIPAGNARSLGLAGSATGLTSRALGDGSIGAETVVLVTANLPAYTPTGTINNTFAALVNDMRLAGGGSAITNSLSPGMSASGSFGSNVAGAINISGSATFVGTAQGGTSTAVNKMPPMTYVNVMIKL